MMFLLALSIIVTLLSFFLITKILANFQPGDKRVEKDIQKMKEEMEAYAGDLVPISKEELELFSMSQVKQLLKKGITTKASGVFTTIYDEPIVAYTYKKYVSPGVNAVLYARTSNHEIVYRIRNQGIQIAIDNEIVGNFKDDGVLYGMKSNLQLAKISQDQPEFLPVSVNNREVGSVTKALPAKAKSLSQRAFEFVKKDMSKEEEAVFLSLAILELVQRTVDQKD